MGTLRILLVLYGVMELVNYLTKRYAYSRLIYRRSTSRDRLFAGESLTLSIEMTNKKLLPLPFVELVEKMPEDLKYEVSDNVEHTLGYILHYSTMMLLPYQKIVRKFNVTCGKRGRYYFNDYTITVGDFFGLKTYSKDFEAPGEVLVYPPVKPLETLIVDYRNPMGDISVKRWIIDDPNIIMGIREYTQKDPFNKIHWVSSARTGQLMVKNFDYTSSQKVIMLLNVETAKPFWSGIDGEKIERVAEIAAAFSDGLLKEGMAVGLYTNAGLSGSYAHEGNYLNPSCSKDHLQRILAVLARVTYSIQKVFEESLLDILESPDMDCQYVIITPIVTPRMAELIKIMDGRYCRITLISYPSEYMGMLPDSIIKYSVREEGVELEAV